LNDDGTLKTRARMLPEGHPSSRTVPKALPKEGDLVDGKYRIERVIGEGGMGRVYAAHHEVLDQRVAIKLLFAEVAERPNVVERFLREAKAAAKLKSDYVARVMDAGTAESGLPFIVMECLEGADLMELVKLNGPMPEGEVVDIMLQALEAIAHAHAAEIVHRDLKPSNIFLALGADGTNVVKVLDFGIAKSLSAASTEDTTLTGQNMMGSPAYMSPEQIRNARTVDTRSDLWSLGVVMYELMTGKLPFEGEGIGELLAAVLEQAPMPARARKKDVSEALEKIMVRALARDREQRYASAAEFARALAPFASSRYRPLADRIEGILVVSSMPRGTASSPRVSVEPRRISHAALSSEPVTSEGPDPSSRVDDPNASQAKEMRPTKKRAFVVALATAASLLAGGVLLSRRDGDPWRRGGNASRSDRPQGYARVLHQ
jgi:serine/threonine protein kinase